VPVRILLADPVLAVDDELGDEPVVELGDDDLRGRSDPRSPYGQSVRSASFYVASGGSEAAAVASPGGADRRGRSLTISRSTTRKCPTSNSSI